MESISERLKNKELALKKIAAHPKHKMLDEFYQRVNPDLVSNGYKAWSKKRLAVKISHLSEMDMSYLLKRMSQSSNPAKVFFGSLKVK